jgi:hypothetical protein
MTPQRPPNYYPFFQVLYNIKSGGLSSIQEVCLITKPPRRIDPYSLFFLSLYPFFPRSSHPIPSHPIPSHPSHPIKPFLKPSPSPTLTRMSASIATTQTPPSERALPLPPLTPKTFQINRRFPVMVLLHRRTAWGVKKGRRRPGHP